jgi:hypothetical protein
MMNLLLWRPQRLKVLSTKLLAVLVGLTVVTTVTAAAWTGLFSLIARQRGSLDSMTAGAWRSFALMEVRALALVLVVVPSASGSRRSAGTPRRRWAWRSPSSCCSNSASAPSCHWRT